MEVISTNNDPLTAFIDVEKVQKEALEEVIRFGIEDQIRDLAKTAGTHLDAYGLLVAFERYEFSLSYDGRTWSGVYAVSRYQTVRLCIGDVEVFYSQTAEPNGGIPMPKKGRELGRWLITYRPGPWVGSLLDVLEEAKRIRKSRAMHAELDRSRKILKNFAPVDL